MDLVVSYDLFLSFFTNLPYNQQTYVKNHSLSIHRSVYYSWFSIAYNERGIQELNTLQIIVKSLVNDRTSPAF